MLAATASNKRAADAREKSIQQREEKLARQERGQVAQDDREARASIRRSAATTPAAESAKVQDGAQARQKTISDNDVRQKATDEAAAVTAGHLHISNEKAATARWEAERESLQSNVKMQVEVVRLQAAAVGAVETSKANEVASKAKAEAVGAKAKIDMFELLLKSKAEDADTAPSLAVAHHNAGGGHKTERMRAWARDDSVRREKSDGQSERQRSQLSLAAMYQSKDQQFSAAAAAAGLMQVAIGPDAAARTNASNNEPRPMAPATLTSEAL